MNNTAAARAFGVVSILGLLTAVVATVIGHIGLGPGYDPLKLTISDYALSNRGVTIEIAMVALAIGAPALLAGLRAVGVAIRGLPTVLLSIWSVGLLIAAIVPTDPPEAVTMSTAALVHRYASVAAFVVLPIAAAVIAARFAGLGRAMTSAVRWLCVTTAVGVALLWYVAFPGGRVMMGLVERGLVGVEIAILAVLSIAVVRAAKPAGRGAATTRPSAAQPTTAGTAPAPHPAPAGVAAAQPTTGRPAAINPMTGRVATTQPPTRQFAATQLTTSRQATTTQPATGHVAASRPDRGLGADRRRPTTSRSAARTTRSTADAPLLREDRLVGAVSGRGHRGSPEA